MNAVKYPLIWLWHTTRRLVSGYGRIVLLSALVGIIAGMGAIVFYAMLDAAKYFFLGAGAHYYPPGPGGELPMFSAQGDTLPVRRLVLLFLPALGGLASGWLVFRFAPEAEGHGTDAAIEAYHHKGGKVRPHVPLIKALASALTIGTGGSGGREGPIAQIGAGFGSALASWLKLSARERRILMGAGLAGGVGAIFHAPMAGALFAAEVLYKDLDLEYELIIPSIISSIIAYAVFAVGFGWDSLFVTPDFLFRNPLQLGPYSLLAVLVAGGAILYIKVFYSVRNMFHRSVIPPMLRPAVGGAVVGVIGLFLPQALCTGYGIVQKALVIGTEKAALFGPITLGLLLAAFAGKILTTAFSIGSGGSGGVFGPAIVIGGCLGGAVGIVSAALFPSLGIQPGAFVIVGMAAFFGAAANTPISTIIMVSEMTGNYHLLVPSMWVCILAYLMVGRHTLYEKQLSNRFHAPVHLGNMMEAVLRNIMVSTVLARAKVNQVAVVPRKERLPALLTHFARIPQSGFPVVDENDSLVGVLQGRELRSAIGPEKLEDLIIAEDLMVAPVTVTEDDDLMTALQRMINSNRELVIVVDRREPHKVVATLTHADILSAYHHELTLALR